MVAPKIKSFNKLTLTDNECYSIIVVDDMAYDCWTAQPYKLSKKERKLMNDEEKTQKWKNKMRKFDKI